MSRFNVMPPATEDHRDDERERCPVCFANDWEIDYMRTDDGEMQVDTCAVCGWPPPSPYGVHEWRDKWLTLGETQHSHPGPSHLRHIALLLELLDPKDESK